MGRRPEEVRESLRFSFGWTNSQNDAVDAAEALTEIVGTLR